jgi:hypothetical protein
MRAPSKSAIVLLALSTQLLVITDVSSLSVSHRVPDQDPRPITLFVVIAPGTVVGGQSTTASISLTTPAPSGGAVIKLTSQLPQVAVFEATGAGPSTSNTSAVLQITIPEGASTAKVGVRTFGVAASTGVPLRAEATVGTAAATLTVNPATVSGLVLAQPAVIGGNNTTGTVQLNGAAAPSTGTPVQLATNMIGASVPPVVTVPPGASSIQFTVSTTQVLSDVTGAIGATAGTTVSALLTVRALTISALTFVPTSVIGGTTATGTVVLTGAASPTRAVNVSLSSNRSDVIVPRNVSIVGSDRASFTISTQGVNSTQTVAITARTAGGATTGIADGTSNTIIIGEQGSSISANLTIAPGLVLVSGPRLQSVSVQPAALASGSPVSVTPTLQSESLTQVNVSLSTDRPDLLQLPATVTIPGGTSATVNATTRAVLTNQTVRITATIPSGAVSTNLLLQAETPIAAFTARPNPVTGGVNIIAQLTLTSGFANPVEVKLSSDNPGVIEVPAAVNVPTSTPLFLTLKSSAVKERTAVTITATAGTQTISATVIVTP